MTILRRARIVEPCEKKAFEERLANHFQYYYQPQFSLKSKIKDKTIVSQIKAGQSAAEPA